MSSEVSLEASPFRIWALGLQTQAPKGLIRSRSALPATPVLLQPEAAGKPSAAAVVGRPGASREQSSHRNTAFQAKITSLSACQSLSTIQLCWRRAQLSSASEDDGKKVRFAAEEGNNCCRI